MDLARTQLLSLTTKAITTVLGIAQSVIVIRLLSPAEFGLVGLVMSIGGVIGVSQHLGIVDGAIREIAVLKSKKEIGKVFWVSHAVRQAVTIPLSLGLVVLAGVIAVRVYDRPEIIPYIQLFGAVLILQGLQDVLGATLTGRKLFKALYAVQIVTAAINIAVFGYLVWTFSIIGFFWAIVVTTAIMVALLLLVVTRDLAGYLRLPTWQEVRQYARRVMRVGAYMYLSRIFFVVWQRLPLLVLGGVLLNEELGFINVSLTFGSKLTIIAMALSEVNLSWMSSLYTDQRDDFRRVVTRNMQRVLVLMMGLTLLLLFFTPEILRYIIGVEYLPAQPIIYIMTAAFFLYSLIDIGTSSVFVPANEPRLRAVLYGVMTLITGAVLAWLLLASPAGLLAAYGVFGGAVVSYAAMVILAQRQFGVRLLTTQLALFLVALGLGVWWLLGEPSLGWRIAVFLLLAGYVVWEARRSDLLPQLRTREVTSAKFKVICFAGAEFGQASWTNRQHVMSRVSKQYPVLYVEPRVWLFRYLWERRQEPRVVWSFLRRLLWYQQVHDQLFLKAQANLIPGSRDVPLIGRLNHWLNRWNVLLVARWLGFRMERESREVLWLYDTEAVRYLSAFPRAYVLYDCVDDHAAQAGVDRSASLVKAEEAQILKRADVVTVTSKKLLAQKQRKNPNVHLVLNAGDVDLFQQTPPDIPLPAVLRQTQKPIIGTVGALDTYKVDFELLREVAERNREWQFVLLGKPIIDRDEAALQDLARLSNVAVLGPVPRELAPAYVARFSVAMIPYRPNRYNEASFPLKFWEFMATGKPVVVSGLPELQEYDSLIGYAADAREFERELARALTSGQVGRDKRMALAREHGWDQRVERLLALLDTLD